MKKINFKAFLVVLLAVFFITLPVNAEPVVTTGVGTTETQDKAYFKADDSLSVNNVVNGSSFVAGNNVSVSGTVDGVLFEAGNVVKHDGKATYAAIAGNTIEILGTYEKDVAIAGNIITVRSEASFGRDVAIIGSEVTISGEVNRDIAIYAEKVYLKDVVINGTAEIVASSIEFAEGSKIVGDLKTNLVDNVDKTHVGGNVIKVETDDLDFDVNISYADMIKAKVVSKLYSFVSLIVVFVVLSYFFPVLFTKASKYKFGFTDSLSLVGYGLVALVFVPVVSILLMLTMIAIPLCLISLSVYFISIYLSTMYTGLYVGKYLWEKVFKKSENIYASTSIGIALLTVLSLIPVLGSIISFVSLVIGLGLIVISMKKK